MLRNDLVEIKKMEAEAVSRIEKTEKKNEAGLEQTRISLKEKLKNEIEREYKRLGDLDRKKRSEIDTQASNMIKKGNKEVVKLRKRVERRVGKTGKVIFTTVLEELEKE